MSHTKELREVMNEARSLFHQMKVIAENLAVSHDLTAAEMNGRSTC